MTSEQSFYDFPFLSYYRYKALFTLRNSQATQRKLEYCQFELPVRRMPTGDIVPHTDTVKRFSLPPAVVNPRSTVLALFIKTTFPWRTGDDAQETQLTGDLPGKLRETGRIRVLEIAPFVFPHYSTLEVEILSGYSSFLYVAWELPSVKSALQIDT